MQNQTSHNQRKPELKLKTIKDFGFLLNHKPIPISQNFTKYVLEEGLGDPIGEDTQNFDMVYSQKKYDYQGKTVAIISCGKLSKFDKKDLLVKSMLLGMKIKEKAWFNVCNTKIYRKSNTQLKKLNQRVDQQIALQEDTYLCEDNQCAQIITQVQQKNEQQNNGLVSNNNNDFQETNQNLISNVGQYQFIQRQNSNLTGIHYQLILERIQYKNGDRADTKRKVFSQKKQEGKKLFLEQKYQESARIYTFLDSITANLPKYKKDAETGKNTQEPFYTIQQRIQLQNMNTNSRINYLKCMFKMIEHKKQLQEQEDTIARRNINFLLQKHPNDSVVHFLHAKWLLRQKRIDDALDAAKISYKLEKTLATEKLINFINKERANRGKVKVKLNDSQH